MTTPLRLSESAFPSLNRGEISRAVAQTLPLAAGGDEVAPEGAPRMAAVLCPVVEREDGLWVWMVRRGDHLRRHAGQIAFPGGKVEDEDSSPLAGALREAQEEIGIDPARVEVVGALAPYLTITGFLIIPFVGFVEAGFRPEPDGDEIAEAFQAPLDFLLDPEKILRQKREYAGRQRFYYAIPYNDRNIWGATAGMLKSLSERVQALRESEGRLDRRFGAPCGGGGRAQSGAEGFEPAASEGRSGVAAWDAS